MKILEYFIYLILKFLNILPQNIQNLIGKALGKIFFKKLDERREIARWNLKKCFPEKTDEEISTILKLSFIRLGESLFEFLNAFWASDKKLKKLIINFDEIKNITEDLDKSKGRYWCATSGPKSLLNSLEPATVVVVTKKFKPLALLFNSLIRSAATLTSPTETA